MMDENLKAIQVKLDEIEQLLARAQGEMAVVRRLLRDEGVPVPQAFGTGVASTADGWILGPPVPL